MKQILNFEELLTAVAVPADLFLDGDEALVSGAAVGAGISRSALEAIGHSDADGLEKMAQGGRISRYESKPASREIRLPWNSSFSRRSKSTREALASIHPSGWPWSRF